jgi:hypothetical protein
MDWIFLTEKSIKSSIGILKLTVKSKSNFLIRFLLNEISFKFGKSHVQHFLKTDYI